MKRCLSWLAAGAALHATAGTVPAPLLDGPEVVKLEWSTRALQSVDLNGDGRIDLAVVNNDRARIDLLIQAKPGDTSGPAARRQATLNRWEPILEDARFTKDNFVTGITVHDLVTADLDGDRRPDLIYTGDPDTLTVVRQKPDGTWNDKLVIDVALPSQIVGNLRVEDLNGDRRPDIAILGQKELSLLLQRPDGTFARPTRYLLTEDNLFGLSVLDLNRDGRVDILYLANHPREPMRVRYQGRAAGEFGPELAYRMEPAKSSMQVLRGGKNQAPSLAYVEQRTGQVGIVQLQPRAGVDGERRVGRPRVFAPRGAGRQGLSYAFADFNGDGRPDIAATDPDSAQIFLYLRQGDEGFAPEAVFPSLADARALATADWDGDQRADLFIASGKEQLAGYTALDADGRFGYPKPLPGKGRALAIAAGVLTADQPAKVLVLREDAGKRSIDFIQRGQGGGPEIVRTLELPAQRGDPKAMRLLDFNQDGLLDLAVFTPFESLKLWVQSAGGTWTEASAAPAFRRGLVDNLDAGRVTTADVDGDGKDEIVVSGTGFARALRLNAAGELVIVDQFNGRDATAEIGTALLLPPATAKSPPDFLLYERKSGEFQTLQRDDRKVYVFSGAQPVGKIEPVAAQVTRSPSGHTEIMLFGADRFWWMPLDQADLEARKTGGYSSDLREIVYADVFAGDLNGDGQPELICNDAQHNLIEVLATDDAATGWRSRLHFSVFDRDAHVQQKRNSPFEPREMIAADVTGDGRQDLILLVHDRVLVYPQVAPSK